MWINRRSCPGIHFDVCVSVHTCWTGGELHQWFKCDPVRRLQLLSSYRHWFWTHGQRWGCEKGFGKPLNTSLRLRLWPLEPTLSMRILPSARWNGAECCTERRSPVPRLDLTETVLSVGFNGRIICQGLESHQSGIVKRRRSTPRPRQYKEARAQTPPLSWEL